MGVAVLIMGASGSGKTYSIKGMNPQTTGIFLVEKPRLPFREKFPNVLKNAGYRQILASLREAKLKSYIIDDSQYLLVNEFFDRAREIGYQKFTDMALNFRGLIHYVNTETPDSVIVYFLHHIEQDANGLTKAKTIGRLLDEKLTVEGCFDIVLRTEIDQNGRWFRTQSDGFDTTKSPEGMFDLKIPNDLVLVDQKIREYYEMEV